MKLDVITELAQNIHLSEVDLKGRSLELFKILRKYPSIGDKEIISDWYGNDINGSNYLWKIKQKLFHELIGFYLNHSPEEHERAVQKDYYFCHRVNAVANILLGEFKRKAAVLLAKEGLTKALKHQFTPIIVSLSTLLYRHYGVFAGDKKRSQQYKTILDQYLHIQQLELQAESYYIEIVSDFPKSKKISAEVIAKGEQYAQQLKPSIGQVASSRFHLMTFNLIVAIEKLKGEPYGIAAACEQANEYFEKVGETRSGIRFIFNYNQIPPFIALGDFQKLEQPIKSCLSLSPEGTFNWVAIHQYKVIANFYKGDFEAAYNLLVTQKAQAQKHPSLSEMWLILEAYAHFFTNRNYRLHKFLNEVPIYSKDKRGMNVNILIIQVLFKLLRKQFDELIDNTKTLEHYTTRYLYDDATLRSNCLIKMILLVEKYSFKRKIVEKRVAPLFEKLKLAPIRDIDVEPVRYEVVWEKVLELLK